MIHLWDTQVIYYYVLKLLFLNPPVVFPKKSCDVHLFRNPCMYRAVLRNLQLWIFQGLGNEACFLYDFLLNKHFSCDEKTRRIELSVSNNVFLPINSKAENSEIRNKLRFFKSKEIL